MVSLPTSFCRRAGAGYWSNTGNLGKPLLPTTCSGTCVLSEQHGPSVWGDRFLSSRWSHHHSSQEQEFRPKPNSQQDPSLPLGEKDSSDYTSEVLFYSTSVALQFPIFSFPAYQLHKGPTFLYTYPITRVFILQVLADYPSYVIILRLKSL